MNKMIISGRGYKEYLAVFEQGKIKPGDNLIVKNKSLEDYYVNEDSSLEWGNVSTREALRNRGIDGKFPSLDNVKAEKILSRRKWYVKKPENCIKDFSDSEIFEKKM